MFQERQIRRECVGMCFYSASVGVFFFACLIFSTPCFGQTKLESMCRGTRDAFLSGEWNGKILRDDVFSSDCTIEVTLSGERRLYVNIEQYGSVKETMRELKSDLSYLLLASEVRNAAPKRRIRMKLDSWWNFGTAYRRLNSMMLLQRDVFYILVIASDKKDLVSIEQTLRRVGTDVGI